jgi:hypothetical protein
VYFYTHSKEESLRFSFSSHFLLFHFPAPSLEIVPMAEDTAVSAVVENFLKQQCLDPSGLYNWDRKRYRLSVGTGILEILDAGLSEGTPASNDAKLSIRGAKYAKEWSILTPAIGSYGFDIVWTSGGPTRSFTETCQQHTNSTSSLSLYPLYL